VEEIGGADAAVFPLSSPPSLSVVAPGASTGVVISFAHPGYGQKSARLTIYSNDPAGTYTVNLQGMGGVDTPTFSPPGGTYNSAQSVNILCATTGAVIYYTEDNSAPTTGSSVFSTAIAISGPSTTKTIKAFATKPGAPDSTVASATYIVNTSLPQAAAPIFSSPGGLFFNPQSVIITASSAGTIINYTIDGSDPTSTSGTQYTGPVTVNSGMTLKAIAFGPGWADSLPTSASFTFQSANPTFSLPSGTYTGPQSVRISSSSPGMTIRYTLDGTTPNGGSGIDVPSDTFVPVTATGTLQAYAHRSGWVDSGITSGVYTIIMSNVQTPVITPTTGRIGSAQKVNITCGTAGATILYTLDGSTPMHSGTTIMNGIRYSDAGPFKVRYGASTVRAIGFLAGYSDSAPAVEIFSNPLYVYATNQGTSSVSAFKLDTSTGGLTVSGTYLVPYPTAITTDPLGRFLFVASTDSGGKITVFSIDPSTGALLAPSSYSVGGSPVVLRYHPTQERLYAANSLGGTVSAYFVNPANGALTPQMTYPAGAAASSLAMDPFGRFLYVVNEGATSVSSYAISAFGTLSETINSPQPMGASVTSAAVEASGQYLYATDQAGTRICGNFIDPATGALSPLPTPFTTTATGISPEAVVTDPTGSYLYCVGSSLNIVEGYRIDSGSGDLSFITQAPTGGLPRGIAVDPSGKFLFVTSESSSTVWVFSIDTANGTIAFKSSGTDPGQISVSAVTVTGIAQ
jgi:6-phosphogluconolactonase (cycloisomerase 2 family)